MSKKSKSPPSFEEAMSQLEALVNSMESDTLSLEESLKQFELGIHLTQICQKSLHKAEQDIKILTSKQEEISFEQDD